MLRTALDSLFAQSLRDFEVVIQDDSTDDECEKVVAGMSDRCLKYTHNPSPLGTVHNLLAGYRKCRGKYFCTLNDDDVYGPDYLSSLVSVLENNPSFSLAFCDHFIINEAGVVLEGMTESNSARFGRTALSRGAVPDVLRSSLVDKCVPGMFAVFRTGAIDLDDFPNEVSSGYDYWLTYLAVRNGSSIYYEPRRLTYYRAHMGSQTSSFTGPQERLRFLRYSKFVDTRFLDDDRLKRIWPDVRKRLSKTLASEGYAHLRLKCRVEAFESFRASLRHNLSASAVAGIALAALPHLLMQPLFTTQDKLRRAVNE